ncbi:endonuclease/exonuclease/phosphatase family protein [Planctomicrobium piriforme]|uniref:Uncharacterized conserved protein YafD, endonuclease/exonuclease/phosphatase (EEP) superfamily n=1 Tax=Planctomicrobium piriforme TaxID=1576369 RepID=A0A1I3AT11_9PLAN|nr:endonuclease/exonuclease/phosphatase family protein [Planctomicrobium piriforme]SFH53258.1 Uncharacterized conserved protein YafD, endonuclease/exonuclease/phosphatase (EEP) superfamily [Planctomicrobium piriforme]
MNDDTPPTVEPRRELRFRVLAELAAFGSGVLLFILVLSWGARWHWRFELLTHFQLQYLIAAALLCLLLVLLRRFRRAIIPGVVLLITLARIAPLYWPATVRADASAPAVSLVLANVNFRNHQVIPFIDWLRHEQPDIVVINELTDNWLIAMQALQTIYPHKVVESRTDPFGIGVYSRIPIEESTVIAAAHSGFPSIKALFQIDGKQFTVLATHPNPPMGERAAEWRNQQMQDLGDIAAAVDGPVILAGDLNCSPWSPYFHDLLKLAQLRNGASGFGLQLSWPTKFPSPLRIPIDHTLVSEEFEVTNRRIGPHIGSDHLPVRVDLKLK